MKAGYGLIILLLNLQVYSQPTMVVECNTGVTTELTSSSNCRPGSFNWQGWACGINGTVIRSTTNIGGQWVNVTGHGIPLTVNLNNICGVDGQTAFVCGTQGSNTWVWKTTNGGQNWFQVFTQPNGFINAVWMKNYLQGFMVGNPVNGRWSLWKTTNGGINWDSTGLYLPQSGNETGWSNSLCIPMGIINYPSLSDTNKIWFGTNNYRIYFSSNYGQSWTPQSTSPEQNSYCIAYGQNYMTTTIHAGGSNYVLKTSNYGMNWTTDTVGGSGNIVGITFGYWSFFLVRENKIYAKIQPGNWFPCYTAPNGTYRYLDNRGFDLWVPHYAVRSNGGITFLTEGEGVKKNSSEIPTNFSLYQNYPNPFNPVTKIKFDIPPFTKGESGGFVTMKIYDILGREVAILVNEQLKPGTYEVEWDGTNYPSGVYFYKLITAEFVDTKRMVLVK